MKRFAFTLDLKGDKRLIAEYERWHREVWPEIQRSILDAGILSMEIYRFSNRLFMVMDVDHTFTFERKAAMDAANEKVQEWESLMWNYQDAVPGAKPGEKWAMMDLIFQLKK